MAIGSHQSAVMAKDEWLTPPWILERLGLFHLDPCSPIDRPWPTAKQHYTIEDNGLMKDWHGRVWLNPPYGKHLSRWLERMAMHGDGIALIFARTETEAFHRYVWGAASSVLFIKGRLFFHNVDGTKGKWTGGAPSVLVGYGRNNDDWLEGSGIQGKFIRL